MKTPNLKTFHDRLDYMIRKHKHLTQMELGNFVGVSQSHISGLRKGTSQPSRSLVGKLARVLCCPEAWLEYGCGDELETIMPINAHDLEPMLVYIKGIYDQIENPSDKFELIGQVYRLLKMFKISQIHSEN